MKGLIDGKVVELTEAQEELLTNNEIAKVVTDKDRISALESAIADLAVMLVGGIDNG